MAVSQVKLMSVLIVLLVITECSWSSAVSSLGGILSLRQSFLPAARSSNALCIIRKTRGGGPKWPKSMSVNNKSFYWLKAGWIYSKQKVAGLFQAVVSVSVLQRDTKDSLQVISVCNN